MATPLFTRRLLALAATLSLPALFTLLALTVTGRLAPWPAAGGAAFTLILTVLLLRPYCADVRALSGYLRDLSRGEEAVAPRLHSGLAEEVMAAIGQVRRNWRQHATENEALIGFHQSLFDALPSPLFLLNAQRRIVRANQAASQLFGRQLQGRDLAAVLRNPAVLDAAEKILRGGEGSEVEFSLPGPSERELRAMLEPLPKIGGDDPAMVIWLHDITELRRMEQMRADFVANASHELRTPLSALLGFIETLRGPARDDAEARDRFLSIMQDQATRMSRLVADLLNLSRIELNEGSRPEDEVDIAPILRRVAEGLQLQASRRRISLILDIPPDLPTIVGQEDELEQVVQNLMDNALKYGREDGSVEVSARLANALPSDMAGRFDRALAIAFRDEGEGVAPEHIPRLTERFFRVDTARSKKLGGTGLGLAIVKHVLNHHRGQLTIDSQLGMGSVFTVYLPLNGKIR